MLTVISPAKNLDYESPVPLKKATKASMLDDSQVLVDQLKTLAPHKIAKLMGVSDKLATLNFDRYQAWQLPFTAKNARQAVYAFNGDVYAGLRAYSMSEADMAFAQEHLRILSGLYGLLRPLDRIQAYRLEMGTQLRTQAGKDLYAYWGDRITQQLNKQIKKSGSQVLVNLASNEYFKVIKPNLLGAEVIHPVFKDLKQGEYKIISFFAKKARGRMSAYIIKNQIKDASEIKGFDWDGYRYNPSLSQGSKWVFTRDEAP